MVNISSFYETARQHGLVLNRHQAAETCLQDAIDIHRPPSDMRFVLAQMVGYGASREALENRSWKQFTDDEDNHVSVPGKIHMLLNPDKYESSAYQDDDET
jgi:hypothetical protein